jgi:hypothetical protein
MNVREIAIEAVTELGFIHTRREARRRLDGKHGRTDDTTDTI